MNQVMSHFDIGSKVVGLVGYLAQIEMITSVCVVLLAASNVASIKFPEMTMQNSLTALEKIDGKLDQILTQLGGPLPSPAAFAASSRQDPQAAAAPQVPPAEEAPRQARGRSRSPVPPAEDMPPTMMPSSSSSVSSAAGSSGTGKARYS